MNTNYSQLFITQCKDSIFWNNGWKNFLVVVGIIVTMYILMYQVTLANAESNSLREKTAETFFEEGVANLKMNNFEKSIKNLKKAVREKEIFPEAHNALGDAYGKIGKIDLAIVEFKIAIEQNPEYNNPYFNLGFYLNNIGQNQDAIDPLKTFLRLNPKDAGAHRLLGIVYVETGNLTNARMHFEKALEIDEKNENTLVNLGYVFSLLGSNEKAIEHYKRALTVNPLFTEALYNLGLELWQTGKNIEAIEELQKAIKINPSDFQANNSLGIMLLEFSQNSHRSLETKREFSRHSIMAFKQVIKLRPDLAEGYYNLGLAYEQEANFEIESNSLDEAINFYRIAISLAPEFLEPRVKLAQILRQKGQLNEAAQLNLETLSLNSDLALAKEELGRISFSKGKMDLASNYFEDSLNSDPLSFSAWIALGDTYRQTNDLKKANKSYTTGRSLKEFTITPTKAVSLSTTVTQKKNENLLTPTSFIPPYKNLGKTPVSIENSNIWWNAWVDLPGAFSSETILSPQNFLNPEKNNFKLVVHWTPFPYDFSFGGQSRKRLEGSFLSGLKRDLVLDVVLLTDPRFFVTPSGFKKKILISKSTLSKYAKLQKEQRLIFPVDALSELKDSKHKFPPYVFAEFLTDLKITGEQGNTAIGISLWDEGEIIEEISIPICIARDHTQCDFGKPRSIKFGSSGSLGQALIKNSSDSSIVGSIYLVELFDRIVGLIGLNSPKPLEHEDPHVPLSQIYHVWEIDKDTESFVDNLNGIQIRFSSRDDPVMLGEAFGNLLFPDTLGGTKARTILQGFMTENRGGTNPFLDHKMRIMVRAAIKKAGEIFLYPIGLMLLGPKYDENQFIGFYFSITTPLRKQNPVPQLSCVSEWITILPNKDEQDGPLREAIDPIKVRYLANSISPKKTEQVYEVIKGESPAKMFNNFSNFLKYWREGDSQKDPSIISILSHHGESILDLKNSKISFLNLQNGHGFQSPSIAILSGCSTSGVGAGPIINALNKKGIDTIITTNTGISGTLAGEFLKELSLTLENAKLKGQKEIAIGKLYLDTLHSLYELKKDGKGPARRFGPFVLSFTLAGNPNIKICTTKINSK